MSEEWFTVAELPAQLKVSSDTILRAIHEGQLEAVQIGVQWRVSRRAVDEWLEQRSNRKDEDEWLTPQKIAEQLKIAKKTVWRHISCGELKASRIGTKGDWRVKASDLQAFLEESTRQGRQD